MVELKDVLRTNEVLQAMFAEVSQRGLAGQLIAHQVGRGGREQRLAAVSNGHEPRGAVERRAIVITGAFVGFAGVQSDADAQDVRFDLIPA